MIGDQAFGASIVEVAILIYSPRNVSRSVGIRAEVREREREKENVLAIPRINDHRLFRGVRVERSQNHY